MNKRTRSKPPCKYCRDVLLPAYLRWKSRRRSILCSKHKSKRSTVERKHRLERAPTYRRKGALHRLRRNVVARRSRYIPSKCRIYRRRDESSPLRPKNSRKCSGKNCCVNCRNVELFKYISTNVRTTKCVSCHKKCPESKIQKCKKCERVKICKNEPTGLFCANGKRKRSRSRTYSHNEDDRDRDIQFPISIKSERLTQNDRRIRSGICNRPKCNDEKTYCSASSKSNQNQKDIKLIHNCALSQPIPLCKKESKKERDDASSIVIKSDESHRAHEGTDIRDKKPPSPMKCKDPCIDPLCMSCPNKGDRLLLFDKYLPTLSTSDCKSIGNPVVKRPQKKRRLSSSRPAPKSIITDPPAGHILVRILDRNGYDKVFQMKKSTDMFCLKVAYSNLSGMKANSLKFRFDGHVVENHMTPTDIGMENEDIIEVYSLHRGCTSDEGGNESKDETKYSQLLPKEDVEINSNDPLKDIFKIKCSTSCEPQASTSAEIS